MRIELDRALRRLKPDRHRGSWTPRPDELLPFVEGAEVVGIPLLLDTTVYVDTLQGVLPSAAKALLLSRPLFHHPVVLAELSHNFGRLDPGHPQTRAHLDKLAQAIGRVPPHRVEPGATPQVMLAAGILTGLVFRLGGRAKGQEVKALNDAILYLHALERGYAVLTRNISDFDLMNQLVPGGRMLLYRTDPA